MSVFKDYASYYDLLYKDKDYTGEVEFISKLISQYSKEAVQIVELGCGTGKHAISLVEKGYSVHGVDMSEFMIEQANKRIIELDKSDVEKLSFVLGDVRTYRSAIKADVVLSLFHVMSYQTTNEDIDAAFATAKTHLKEGGVYIFDVWFGPAVLNIGPKIAIKRLKNQDLSVTRIAEPTLIENRNIVEVNYEIIINDKDNESTRSLQERHTMRYFFVPEIELLCKRHGMELIEFSEWMTQAPASKDSWGVYFVAKA